MNEERFEALVTAVERLRDQVQRLVADAESEKDTRARANSEIAKLIRELQDEIMHILYGPDRKSGIVVDVDRLNNKMETITKISWLLIGGVVTMAFFMIREALMVSN